MGNIDSSMVSLRFAGEGLEPDLVTQALGYSSDELEQPVFKTRRVRTKRGSKEIGIWTLSYGKKDSLDIELKIVNLLNRLTNDLSLWHSLAGQYRGNLFCGLFLDGWNQGFELSSQLIVMMHDRRLRIGFDIYAPADSLDEHDGE